MRALIVEDDTVSVNILYYFVKDFFNCDTANDGKEGWNKFIEARESSNPYDYIFLDIMMPEKDGQALLNDIRNYEKKNQLKKCKIIMTTALSDFDTVVKSFENKCDDYITKPIDKEKVLTVLERNGIDLSKKI
ncbi:MAG TPA: response regulator [Thermotogota bacterium]|nr:response regulator [Thermotogota bacterium]HRW35191.1 response regulator [Thermotogota bacterium]